MNNNEELTLENGLVVHESWLCEVYRVLKMSYGNARQFSFDNNINYLSVRHFLAGNPVVDTHFKAICNVLDFDWEKIQQDPY